MWTEWLERTLRRKPKEDEVAAPEFLPQLASAREEAPAAPYCHCGERIDEAVPSLEGDCFAALAMTADKKKVL
ncbi:MAG TPA: hypothetical protein VLV50_13080 [Stellaceae bacterium]|nr:hypothetical protein [Stellaceae bacterium]